ncbi:S-layer homology domain-containing protein [Candidatus Gracilibacteria bacterium]|nr:S-layer homology domain-containing protein [Candidatus Gracilibacteria bacterium]
MKKSLSLLLTLSLLITTLPTASAEINYQEKIPSVVLIRSVDSALNQFQGTGFFISIDNLILTNAHVIIDEITGEPAYMDICIIEDEFSTPDCKYLPEVIAWSTDYDLALLRPAYLSDEDGNPMGSYLGNEELPLSYVDFLDSQYLPNLGGEVKILGFPVANVTSGITLTEGKIASFTPYEGDFGLIAEIATDAIVNPGNSGGPAFNADERVMGVVHATSVEGIGGNYGYIISNNAVHLWFLDLINEGTLNQEWVDEIFSNDYINNSNNQENTRIFSDIPNSHKNGPAIEYLNINQIIDGYPDGSFKPDGEINRAELIKMIVAMKVGNPADYGNYTNCFPDITNEWFAPYVCYAKERGWVQGYDDGLYRPENKTNRAEAMKIVENAFYGSESRIPTVTNFNLLPTDTDNNAWYDKFLRFAVDKDILDLQHVNYNQYSYDYNIGGNISRKEVSEMIYRLIQKDEKSIYTNLVTEGACAILEDEDFYYLPLEQSTEQLAFEYGFEPSDNTYLDKLGAKYDSDINHLNAVEQGLKSCSKINNTIDLAEDILQRILILASNENICTNRKLNSIQDILDNPVEAVEIFEGYGFTQEEMLLYLETFQESEKFNTNLETGIAFCN